MTINEWCQQYRREHPGASLTECIRALKASGQYAVCSRESKAKSLPHRWRPKRQRKQKAEPTTADNIIQAGLAELNRSYKRMIERD